jgi:hypothetical protein
VECAEPDFVAPTATLDLKRAYVDQTDGFVGVFELVNYQAYSGLAISLEAGTGDPIVNSGTAFIEFKDLNDSWVKLSEMPILDRDMFDYSSVKTIKAGERLRFRYRMFSRHLLKYGGMEFRLKLYTEPPTVCLVSFPFKAVPEVPRPTGLRAVPHPRPIAVQRR